MDRRLRSLTALSIVGAVLLAATFLPWVHSGSRTRSSYDLLGLLDRLGVAGDGLAAGLIRWWPVVPLLVTCAVVLGWWSLHGWALVVALVASGYVVGVAGVLIVASGSTGVDLGIGVWVATLSGALFVAAAVVARVTAASARVR
jgi:hypothetical protein